MLCWHISFCLFCACNAENNTNEGGCGQVYGIGYTVDVINNTNSVVKVYSMGSFEKDASGTKVYEVWDDTPESLFKIDGKGRKTYESDWRVHGIYYEDFKPYTSAFYLKITIDGNDYYLAGWPAQYTGLIQRGRELVPAGKIALTGLGWAENTAPCPCFLPTPHRPPPPGNRNPPALTLNGGIPILETELQREKKSAFGSDFRYVRPNSGFCGGSRTANPFL
jgi:hypothetical protein